MANEIQLPPGFTLDPTFKPAIELPPGFTLDPTFKPQVSTAEDVGRSAVSGLANGAAGVAGGLGDARGLMDRFGDWIGEKMGYTPEQIEKSHGIHKMSDALLPQLPTTEQVKKITHADELDYEPRTTAGKFTKSAAEFVPGALTGGAGSARAAVANVARFGVLPGLASEGAGELAHAYAPEFEPAARIVAGMATPGAASRLISPNASHAPEASRALHARHVERLEQEGIPVSAGERADSADLRYTESQLDPEAYKAKNEAVTRAATRAVPGFETPVIEHGAGGTVDRMLATTGQRFDDLSARNVLVPDHHMATDLMDLRQHYTTNPNLFDHGTVDALHAAADDVRDAMRTNGGGVAPHLTGEQYQRIRSRINSAARSTESPQRAEALHAFVNVLDNGMERSIGRLNPSDAGAWGAARRDYKNALVIEDASKSSRAGGSLNYITPASIESGAAKVYGRRAHERGHDPFDWAPAAKSVLKIMPDSGTSHRMSVEARVHAAIDALGAVGGGAAGQVIGHGTEGGVYGLLLGEKVANPLFAGTVRNAYGRFVHSRTGQRYLGNQVLAGEPGAVSLPGLLTGVDAARQ